MKKRIVQGNLTRRGEGEIEWNAKFWRDAGTQAKWEAEWQMKIDYLMLKGRDVSELRLRRDVATLKRRKR